MTFSYFEITPQLIRPIIPVILKSKTKLVLYSALIDSGADYCIFSSDIADALGIIIQNEKRVTFVGVGKEKIEGFFTQIVFVVGDISYETDVIFADMSDFGHGILGQKGFFDHFDVHLRYKKQTIEILPIK